MSRSATSAAFFDLDRTLLRGASGPLITEALQAGGLVRDIRVPLLDGVYKFYELFGETLAGMALARRGINMADGWATDAVSDAAHDAADRIAPLIQPYAREVIDEHRSAGLRIRCTLRFFLRAPRTAGGRRLFAYGHLEAAGSRW